MAIEEIKTSSTIAEPATGRGETKSTEVGSVFVSNYPPYSFWKQDTTGQADRVLNAPPDPNATLGLYLHIPFCRKRCKFCYFRVYTDKNASQIETYLNALATEIETYSKKPAVAGRDLKFIYFGGGTPSYIAAKHLKALVERVKAALPWETAQEVAFECEPGTLTQTKLQTIREIGVTRLSLGIENFDDDILRENGRAHVTKEIYRVMPWIRELDFEQLNIDLISGMVGETWETWRTSVDKTIELDPDSVTIYQMELPFNTVYSQTHLKGESPIKIADWKLKREWHDYAIDRLLEAGYEVSSAYTMVKKGTKHPFVYRDSVWEGSDMLGTGVASFGHMSGTHIQNTANWDEYLGKLENGQLPLKRAFVTTPEERLARETLLQLKRGSLNPAYFAEKFNVDVLDRFKVEFSQLRDEGWLASNGSSVQLNRQGLLRVDQLLPVFYAPKYRNSRYT